MHRKAPRTKDYLTQMSLGARGEKRWPRSVERKSLSWLLEAWLESISLEMYAPGAGKEAIALGWGWWCLQALDDDPLFPLYTLLQWPTVDPW